MGVDYDASFGIGVEINEIHFEEEDEFSCMEEYLNALLRDTNYIYDQYGSGSYSGADNTWLIILKDPFKDGYDLTDKVKKLDNFLKNKSIKYGKIDLYGGVLMW